MEKALNAARVDQADRGAGLRAGVDCQGAVELQKRVDAAIKRFEAERARFQESKQAVGSHSVRMLSAAAFTPSE